jgi:hypothetical protein
MIAGNLTRMALRSVGVAIAIAATIDPAITTNRTTKPDVIVVPADSARDAGLANDVARELGKTYTVARGTVAGAGATVVVGRTLPGDGTNDETLNTTAPVFAVTPAGRVPMVSIESFDLPPSAPALSRVRADAVVRVRGARGGTVELSLRDDAVSLDRATRPVTTDDDTIAFPSSFVPTQTGTRSIAVTAHLDGAIDALGDAMIDIRDQKWAVLFYDPRPSWMSTFVRRSIERDPRFVVTARVLTSRDVTTSTGNPPGRLDDLAALSLFDAVVVGAPQALSSADVAGLEAFMRRRGGSVVLLLDEAVSGPVERLIDVPAWRTASGDQPVLVATQDSLSLQATSFIWPTVLPAASEITAGADRAIVWREPVGAGTLLVSGARDAWRFRDPASSSFDRFWRTTIGDAADRTPPPLRVVTSNDIVAPGARFEISAALRDEAIDANPTGPLQVRATLSGGGDSTPVRLWPSGVGGFDGSVRAPDVAGPYLITVSVGGRTAELPVVVSGAPHRVTRGAEARLVDLVRATNGAILPASQLDRLSALLRQAIHVEPRAVTWHPMRSTWWIIPFVLALSSEWWLRRRRGLP